MATGSRRGSRQARGVFAGMKSRRQMNDARNGRNFGRGSAALNNAVNLIQGQASPIGYRPTPRSAPGANRRRDRQLKAAGMQVRKETKTPSGRTRKTGAKTTAGIGSPPQAGGPRQGLGGRIGNLVSNVRRRVVAAAGRLRNNRGPRG